MATGTNGNDTLNATVPGELLYGRRGNDIISSLFNRTKLYGEAGNDRLTIDLERSEDGLPVTLFATLSGGTGKDSLNLTFVGTANDVAMEADLDGGEGDDKIVVNLAANGRGDVSAISRILGGIGNDTIEASIVLDAVPTRSVALNFIEGGQGNDKITARIDGDFSGNHTESTNEVYGGAGDDHIDAIAEVSSNGGWKATNIITGGGGNDTIEGVALASSNSSSEVTENTIDGGAGDDVIIVVGETGESSHATITTDVLGGLGNDDIRSTQATSQGTLDARCRIDGGLGNDRIESTVEGTLGPYGPTKAMNRLEGFDGNDTLIAKIAVDTTWWDGPVAATNRLDGGSGNDAMTATIVGLGRSILNGGSGLDVLKIAGGLNNILSGGSGGDRFFAGSGTDRMIGGGGADDFVFNLAADQSSDRILDFDGDLDRLCFIGITDRGAAGLVNDLDAISTIADEGAGLDVMVTFDVGSVVTFEGCGLGTDYMGNPLIDSIGDLVANARNQLLVEIL